MRRSALAVILTGAAVAVPVARHLRRSRHQPRWRSVTVLAQPDALRLQPLDALQDVQLRLRPAPGDRGTEVHARRRRRGPAADLVLRTALRDAKQLTETGGVLHDEPRSHGGRRRTPEGLLQDEAERAAKGWGLR